VAVKNKSSEDEGLSHIDKLRDEAIDVRSRTLAYLELQIEKQDLDSTEAFHKLKSICLFDNTMAMNYIKTISSRQNLWRLHGIS
jgi:hypothetical protein